MPNPGSQAPEGTPHTHLERGVNTKPAFFWSNDWTVPDHARSRSTGVGDLHQGLSSWATGVQSLSLPAPGGDCSFPFQSFPSNCIIMACHAGGDDDDDDHIGWMFVRWQISHCAWYLDRSAQQQRESERVSEREKEREKGTMQHAAGYSAMQMATQFKTNTGQSIAATAAFSTLLTAVG